MLVINTSNTPSRRGAGTADDPQELSEDDMDFDDVQVLGPRSSTAFATKKEVVAPAPAPVPLPANVPAPAPASAPARRRPGFTYRQPVCSLVPLIQQHTVWQQGCAEVRKKIASALRKDPNLVACLAKLSNEHAQWGCILVHQPDGQAGPCERCAGLEVDCLVQVDTTGTSGDLEVVSRCITCLASGKPCDIPNGRSNGRLKPAPRPNGRSKPPPEIEEAVRRTSRKTGRNTKAVDPTLAELAALPTIDDHLLPPGPSAPKPVAGPSKPRKKSGGRIRQRAEKATGPMPPRKQMDMLSDNEEKPPVNLGLLLPALKEIEVFMERMRVILSPGGELEFETFLMFQKVGEDVGVLKQHATDGAHTASALTSLKRVERFTSELRKMSTKDGELSFRMEIMFDTMDEHVKVFREVLGASK